MRPLLALFLALIAAPAAAQSDDVLNLPQSARAGQDGLVVAIVTTDNLERFALGWRNGQPQSAVTQVAVRGTELKTILLLQNCRPAADGNCNLSGRFTYLLPNGAEYGTVNDANLWREAPRDDGHIQVALGPTLIVDPPDPMGEWTLRAEIRDNVRGITLTVSTPITVSTPPAQAAH